MRAYRLVPALAVAAVLLGTSLAFADPVSVTTTVSSYMTATFNYASVPFSTLSADTSDNAAPSQTDGVYSVTIDTNKNFKLQESGTSLFTDGAGHSFAIANLKAGSNLTAADLTVGEATVLTTSPQTIENNIAYTETIHYHGFWLSIPAAQYAAAYNATVTATYSNM